MDAYVTSLKREYSEEDHDTWSKLYARQLKCVEGLTCKLFDDGLRKLNYDPKRLPDADAVSDRIHQFTGWRLTSAQNEYLGATEWFVHINACRFPVTDYIRRPHELDFTPLPDLFHEYFGHLAFYTDQRFADISQQFGELYLEATNPRQQLEIQKLWWFTIEFAFVREDGEEKILGAGLLSSPGELKHAYESGAPHHPFTIDGAIRARKADANYHDEYFVLDSVEQMQDILTEYALREGLPLRSRLALS